MRQLYTVIFWLPKPAAVLSGAWEFLFLIFVFACVLALAYVVTKFIAKKATGRYKSRFIEVADSLSLGADTQLIVIKAGEESFLIAKSAKQITMLSKLDINAAIISEPPRESALSFTKSFKTVLSQKLGRGEHSQKDKENRREFNDSADV